VSFDWATFLACAETLARAQDEASKRSAISRAYYAAFNVVRVFLRVTPPPGSDSHKIVWDAALHDSRREVQSLGRKGERLKERRRSADYFPTVDNLNWCADNTIEVARTIIAAVETLRRPPAGPVPSPEGNEKPPRE
jgi:hypothetical protein